MASDGARGEQTPPLQTLATTGHGSVDAKCELNIDNLSKTELLTLLSIMEGELEARDLVIEALRQPDQAQCSHLCPLGDWGKHVHAGS
ncbi:hypothetical protein DNTS_003377 [Danionella cerebrum]|uniref:Cortactin-binding protein-2 N-terminal domain-containing protein n=1 Tax=Danionella cerebrum TaxID=2873325 RepID=A0A553NLX1_9TELE|nr:hypothetical protein DNTS_003377 [Danionella translucida]